MKPHLRAINSQESSNSTCLVSYTSCVLVDQKADTSLLSCRYQHHSNAIRRLASHPLQRNKRRVRNQDSDTLYGRVSLVKLSMGLPCDFPWFLLLLSVRRSLIGEGDFQSFPGYLSQGGFYRQNWLDSLYSGSPCEKPFIRCLSGVPSLDFPREKVNSPYSSSYALIISQCIHSCQVPLPLLSTCLQMRQKAGKVMYFPAFCKTIFYGVITETTLPLLSYEYTPFPIPVTA